MRRVGVALRAGLVAAPLAAVLACGETRRPIGEECIRGDDCLSGICSDRACVSAPTLAAGMSGSPPDPSPPIQAVDAAKPAEDAAKPAEDAAGDGG